MKAGLSEIIGGKFVKKGGFESSYILTPLGRRLSRVRIMGIIVDKYQSEDGNYAAITVDDGTETVRCKAFINVKLFDGFAQGDLVDVIGKIREYNGEVYVAPEVLRRTDANWETLRSLELKKIWSAQRHTIVQIRDLQKHSSDATDLKNAASKAGLDSDIVAGLLEAEEAHIADHEEKAVASSELKNKILELIGSLDAGNGADYSEILKKSEMSEEQVDTAIQDLLESGICFEPKAGRIKKL